ncbi:MAG: hypothetical protein EBW68_03445 [Actinobacteria bacterium]|nr:hypothetical protein [Actinomycetota bacterium]
MARGSSKTQNTQSNANDYEMIQSGGQIDNSGRFTISRKYYATNEGDLLKTPGNIDYAGQKMIPSSLSFQKISGGVWEKNIEFTAAVGASQTGVVRSLSTVGKDEGRVQLEVSAELAPIEQHPEIDQIIQKYNGFAEKGKVLFPKTYTGTGTGTSGGTPKPNPFFGMRYYYQPSATLRHTFNVNKMPSNLFANVFKIINTKSLPGEFPDLTDLANKAGVTLKYFWQIQMPQVSRVGDRIEVTNTYTLMKPMTQEAAEDMNKLVNV